MKFYLAPLLALSLCSIAFAQEEVKTEKTETKKVETQKTESTKIEPADKTEPLAKPDSQEHLFGAHAALGFPHPVSLGLDYVHSSRYFSLGVAAGSFGGTFSDVDVNIKNTEFALRWHPFAGSFFVGAMFGNQTITAEKTETIQGQRIKGKAEVTSSYVTPNVGWLWGAQNSGFFASMELGFQSPSGVKTDFTSNADATVQLQPEYQDLRKDVIKQGDDLGNKGLPHIALIKVGWLF